MSRPWKVLLAGVFVCVLAAAVIGWTPLRDSLLGDDAENRLTLEQCAEECVTAAEEWGITPTGAVDKELVDLAQCLLVARAKGYDVSLLMDMAVQQLKERDPAEVHFLLETCQQIIQ